MILKSLISGQLTFLHEKMPVLQISEQEPVSRKSRGFSGAFRVT